MSRIGKQPITVPSGVEVTIDGGAVRVKGPKGQLEHRIVGDIAVARDGDALSVTRGDDSRSNRSLHGLQRSLIANIRKRPPNRQRVRPRASKVPMRRGPSVPRVQPWGIAKLATESRIGD